MGKIGYFGTGIEVSYTLPLPGRSDRIDIVDPNTTAVQRALRRDGLAGYETVTLATLLTLFEQQDDGFSFFDVGANMGLCALLCSAMFQTSTVHAFEPTPSTAATARRIFRANDVQVEVFECALSDDEGHADLHLADVSDSSNSLVPGFQESSASISVQIRRLDDHVAATGVAPVVVKIDVETHEAAVIGGAPALLANHRPYLFVEVLNRGGRDHGVEITEVMEPYGYTYYRLDGAPSWIPEPTVSGTVSGPHRDWLLAPEPLTDVFGQQHQRWQELLATCGPAENSRVPIVRSAVAALRRGGPAELVATAQRFAAARRRERAQASN